MTSVTTGRRQVLQRKDDSRTNIFIPVLDRMTSELQRRFAEDACSIYRGISALHPGSKHGDGGPPCRGGGAYGLPRILQIPSFRNPKGRSLLRVPQFGPQNPAYEGANCLLYTSPSPRD